MSAPHHEVPVHVVNVPGGGWLFFILVALIYIAWQAQQIKVASYHTARNTRLAAERLESLLIRADTETVRAIAEKGQP